MVFSSVSEAIEGSSKKGQILTHKPASPQSADENSVEAVVERSNDCDSSEDDIEVVTDYADNFYITDNIENVVSILDLPLASRMFSNEISDVKQFYLFGKCDNGLQSVMHPINMWKLELGQEPEFSVRTQQGKWIWLKKPAKSYAAGEHRTTLLVAHFLNFVRMNTDASGKEVWAHLRKISCFSEVEPSSNDLVQHSATIRKLVKDNPILEKAQILIDILKKRKGVDDFLAEKKQKLQEPNNSTFGGDVVSTGEVGKFETKRNSERSLSEGDDPDLEFDADVNDSDGEDVGDTVCAICDDGGDILCCDGPCLRSFHATKAAAAKSTSQCISFGFSICAVMEMGKFYCWNCQYNQHQCFACGQLGSSKKPLKEVFVCDVALCGRFYHPACAAKLLVSKEEHASFIERILNSVEAFSCPLHKCVKCKKGDMRESEETRLYGCRRCPRAWHKKCISDKICFYTGEDQPGIRGWEMDGTRFLYCLHHAIDDELGTPARNHLVFPNGHRLGGSKDVSFKKERKFASVGVSVTHVERVKHTKCSSDESPRLKKFESKVSSIKELNRTIFNKPPPVPILHTLVAKKESTTILTTIKPKQPPTYNEDEMKMMLESLVEVSKKTVTSDTVATKLMVPFIYEERATSVKKSISLGKLDSLLHALSKARECLLRGAIEEAECIFPKESFRVLERSKNKLRVYLAPILHGMRYTSFGRHFTKFDKLKEVVNRLHWYVNPGDMVVDFCCGSNDFSRLMFETLEHSRKKCAYKNYDIIQPKHDFNFIKKDWLKVERHELPSGDGLVMGLNPPFGVKAQLANTMIDHVLTFKPKLIILIVPKETRRLESSGYECIWEDPDLLSGQAFYFPGSVDINDKALSQHNLDAPPLYLWSRGDWAARHRKIAAACRHVKFHDLNLQQIAEPISPQFCKLELMPEIHAFGVQSRKRQQATVSELTSTNDGIGFDEEPTEIMHETILATNCNSFGADRPGRRDLESLSSPKQKASDAGTLLEKKSSELSHGKSKTLKEIKQQSRDRHHSELSGSKLKHISRSQTSHWATPSPLEKGYLRERLDSRHLIESKDADRNFPSGRHRNDHIESSKYKC
ncbi:hypothetical protein O6H91_16G032300 [Diphasiastrum complanatum]|uniref:Uncharacterized protein n=1 Tax=Diphasiastrum complanatum TaxID=34168 RepID=A0ACC2BB73_DIPCM|nr:hypothetical protein O6H91_16G032300 [Diphasiastrum complanatum]